MSAETPIFHEVNYFNWYKGFLEYFVGLRWLQNPNHNTHMAVKKWQLCEEAMGNMTIIFNEKQQTRNALLAEIALDASILNKAFGDEYENVEKGLTNILCDEKARHHIETRIKNPEQSDSLMVELYVAVWYLNEGFRARKVEEENYPDIKVIVEESNTPLFMECKRLRKCSENSLTKSVRDTNLGVRFASQNDGIDYLGIAIIDLTIPLEIFSVDSDRLPFSVEKAKEFVESLLSRNSFSSLGAVILVWNDAFLLDEQEERGLIFYRRRSVSVLNESANRPIENSTRLFEGYTTVLCDIEKFYQGDINNVEYTDAFNQYCRKELEIDELQVTETILWPERAQLVYENNGKQYYLLFGCIIDRRQDGLLLFVERVERNLKIHFGFRILKKDYEKLDIYEPLDILKDFAYRFGAPVTIEDTTDKFVPCMRDIVIKSGIMQLTSAEIPDGHEYFSHVMSNESELSGGLCLVEHRLAFCIDITEYKLYLGIEKNSA